MRIVVFLAIALVSASSANSQQFVSLPLEPEVPPPAAATLESAARANDFPAFDALYRANPDPAYRTLHELWTYAMNEPTGAFYGPETYARLAREYPRYGEFIAEYKIVDGNGNAFYPVSETRAFLLERRLPAGRTAGILPAKQVAKHVIQKAEAALPPHSIPKPNVGRASARPGRAEARPTLKPVTRAVTRELVPPPVQQATNRGILLLIIGLVGVGLLALIVRAPREVIP